MNHWVTGVLSIILYCDSGDVMEDYSVLDPAINLSDHLPIVIRCKCIYPDCLLAAEATHAPKVKQLRWDHADLFQCHRQRSRVALL